MPLASLRVQRRSEHSEMLFSKGCANAKRVQEAIVRQVRAPSLRSVHSAEGGAPITARTERLRAQKSESDAVNSGCAQIRAAGYPDEGEELGPYLRPIPERNPHGMVSCL
jgi:hypothetical protein